MRGSFIRLISAMILAAMLVVACFGPPMIRYEHLTSKVPVILVNDEIDGTLPPKFDFALLTSPSEIRVIFDSPGGEVEATEHILEALWRAKLRGIRVVCMADGRVESAAFWLYEVGCTERLATNNSLFMAHEPTDRFDVSQVMTLDQMRQATASLEATSTKMAQEISDRMGRTPEWYHKQIFDHFGHQKHEWLFFVDEALYQHAVDRATSMSRAEFSGIQ